MNKIKLRRKSNRVTTTTRTQIGENISFYLDVMSDPRFKEEVFRAIESRNTQSYALHASNDEMTIHFEMEWKKKGGQ